LVDSATTELVTPEDVPPPFVHLMEGDPNFSELRAWAEANMSGKSEPADPLEAPEAAYRQGVIDDATLPLSDADEDTATYETTTREVEAWIDAIDTSRDTPENDEPPPAAPPQRAIWRADEEDDESDALRPTG
jgi:hypothetical protein